MENPQTENGHVDIANEIVDALARTRFTKYETQVLWVVFRKTYGWKKKEDWISMTQFSEMTGILIPHCSRTVSGLVKRNILTKRGNKISLNKYWSQWRELPNGVTNHRVTKRGNSQLPNGVILELPNGVNTKDNADKRQTLQKANCGSLSAEPTTKATAEAENRTETQLSLTLSNGGKAEGSSPESSAAPAADSGAAARLFDLYEKLSGRAVRVRNKIRTGHMKSRLKEFTEQEITTALRGMAADMGLRGDNKTGVDYFSIEYALRVQNIERYLEAGKRSANVASGREGSPSPSQLAFTELPPLKITRPDGTVVLEYPDGRCVVVESPAVAA